MAGNLQVCTFSSLQDCSKLRFKSNPKLDKTKHAKTQAPIFVFTEMGVVLSSCGTLRCSRVGIDFGRLFLQLSAPKAGSGFDFIDRTGPGFLPPQIGVCNINGEKYLFFSKIFLYFCHSFNSVLSISFLCQIQLEFYCSFLDYSTHFCLLFP